MSSKILCLTSIIPINLQLYYYINYNIINNNLFLISIFSTIFSVGLWCDPINNRNKLIHKLDGACARFLMIYILYNKFIDIKKEINNFLINYFIILFLFYKSNYYSSIEWCSNIHIFYHTLAHISCIYLLYDIILI